MPEPLQIQEPERKASQRPSPELAAFLDMGFRPLYSAGTFWAVASIGLWIFAPRLVTGVLAGPAWHAHEMLWGFVATMAAGFLMTAGATWTGINPMQGKTLALACVLWAVARVGFLVPSPIGFAIAAASESAFFALAALALGRAVYKSRNRRNYAVPWLLLALGVADGLFLMAAFQGNYALLMLRFEAGLLCMALIALLVGRRVIPFFAMKAVEGLQIPLHARSGLWQLAAGASAIAFALLQWSDALALALVVTAFISWWQVIEWKPLAVRNRPILWILYLGHACLGAGLLLAALHATGSIERAAIHIHVLAIGGVFRPDRRHDDAHRTGPPVTPACARSVHEGVLLLHAGGIGPSIDRARAVHRQLRDAAAGRRRLDGCVRPLSVAILSHDDSPSPWPCRQRRGADREAIAMAIHHAASGERIDVRPLRGSLKDAVTKTLYKSDSLEVFRMILRAGEAKPPHQLAGELTVQCIEGIVEFSVAGTSEVMTQGNLKCLAGGAPFSMEAREDSSLLFTLVLCVT